MSTYQFDDKTFDPRTGELVSGAAITKLPPQPALVLTKLLDHAGQLVTRDELRQEIWGDTAVDFEHGLNFCVKQLRAVLGDAAEAPTYIETLRGRGYRFVAPVITPAAGNPSPRQDPMVSGTIAISRWRRIAMVTATAAVVAAAAAVWGLRETSQSPQRVFLLAMPFEIVGDDPDGQMFGDGFSEELITRLGALDPQRIAVVARGTAKAYQRTGRPLGVIAKELDANYVLTGTIRKADGRLRITTQLIDPASEATLWTQSYDRVETDALRIQEELGEAIAATVGTMMAPGFKTRRAVSPAAYEAYLRGRFFWNKRNPDAFVKAIAEFRRAIEHDGEYASAWAGLADAYSLLGAASNGHMSRGDAIRLAREAAQRALQLDATLAEARTSLAFVRMHHDWDFSGAAIEFERALALNPSYATAHHWYAYNHVAAGRLDAAIAEIRRAQRLDPLSVIITRDVCEVLTFARRHDEAAHECLTALELDPSFALARRLLAWNYLRLGRRDDATRELRRIGYALEADVVGGRRVAHEEVEEVRRGRESQFTEPAEVAALYATVGDADRAMAYLEKAYEQRSGSLIVMHADPWLAVLESHPRYEQLRQRVGVARLHVPAATSSFR